jgi:hypothetical protein
MWRNWRERRRQYQIERGRYKAGGGRDARHGGFQGEAATSTDALSKIHGGDADAPL